MIHTAFKDVFPFEAFGGKINPLSEIQNTGVLTNGSVFWVKKTTDADYTTFKDQVGAANIVNDIQSGINKCRNFRNDYVLVIPPDNNSTFTNTLNTGSAFYLNKANVHLIGVGFGRDVGPQNPTLADAGTVGTIDTAVLKITAPGCEVAGLNILGTSGTTANGTLNQGIVWIGTGASVTAGTGTANQTWLHDMSVENLQASGGGAGGTADIIQMAPTTSYCRLDNVTLVARATGAKAINMSANGTRNEVHFSRFIMAAQAVGDTFISTGTGANDWALFEKCQFINIPSATKNTSAITGSITTATNAVYIDYCTGVNVTAFGTDPTCFATGVQSGTAAAGMKQPGIAIAGTAGIPAA